MTHHLLELVFEFNNNFFSFKLDDPEEILNTDVYKLSTVRMAIEEKRRQLEQDKRKKEISQNRHQQEFSKAAFLQAINKVRLVTHTLILPKPTRIECLFFGGCFNTHVYLVDGFSFTFNRFFVNSHH